MCGGVAVMPPKLNVYFREGVGPVVNGTTSWPLGNMGGGLNRESLTPGTYTLDIWDPDGRFEPVESREFQIHGGQRTVVTVELKRSK